MVLPDLRPTIKIEADTISVSDTTQPLRHELALDVEAAASIRSSDVESAYFVLCVEHGILFKNALLDITHACTCATYTKSRPQRGVRHAFLLLYLNGPYRCSSNKDDDRRNRHMRSRAMWLLFLCSRPSDRSGPGCVSTDRNVRSKCRCSNVSCSSHYDAQLTAFFIDPRAK